MNVVITCRDWNIVDPLNPIYHPPKYTIQLVFPARCADDKDELRTLIEILQAAQDGRLFSPQLGKWSRECVTVPIQETEFIRLPDLEKI